MNGPRIGRHGFGWIELNGQRWDRDVVIMTSGEVVPRPKELSKKYGGWHTVLGPEEVEYVLAGNTEILLIGCGHFGLLPILPQTYGMLAIRALVVEISRLPKTLARFEHHLSGGRRVTAILHLTC